MANIKFSSLQLGAIATGVRLIGMLGDNSMRLFSAADLKGQKGDKGDKGDQGIQGIQGIQGPPGSGSGGGASSAVDLVVTGYSGHVTNQQEVNRRRVSVWDFGIQGTDHNLNTKVGSKYSTLAAAQAKYPRVLDLSLDDQLDWAGLQEAIYYCNEKSQILHLDGAKLSLNRYIHSKGFFKVEGENATVSCKLFATNLRKINVGDTVAVDLSYPQGKNAGVLACAAFYLETVQYYCGAKDITFWDARIGITHLNDANSPIYVNLVFNYCNIGVFHYQGCQNPQYINCGGAPLNVFHVSSATAFPADSPHKNIDNYYSDNATFKCAVGFNSFGIQPNATLDAWFRDSIMRPNVDSYVLPNVVSKYTVSGRDDDPNVFALDADACKCSGLLIFMPYRHMRTCFSLIMENQDSRGPGMQRGYAYVGTEIKALTLKGNQYEQLHEGLPDDNKLPCLLTVGAITSGSISEQAQISYIDKQHPFIAYTGRGRNEGFADDRGLLNAGAGPNLLKDRPIQGYRQGQWFIEQRRINTIFNTYREQYRTDANAPMDVYFETSGDAITNNEVSTLLVGRPLVLTLPNTREDGKIRVQTHIRPYVPLAGYITLHVRNLTTGEADFARYKVQTGYAEERILAQDMLNGQTEVVFTTGPNDGGNMSRYSRWTPASDFTGKGFVVNRYLGGNRLETVAPLSGLPVGGIPAGTTMRKLRDCRVVRPFKYNWVSLVANGFGGGIDFQGDDILAIRNHMADYNSPYVGDALEVTLRASHMAEPGDDFFSDQAPTYGRFRKGARVLRTPDGSSPVLEWVCLTAGEPGTWQAVRWETRTGTTAQRPTLTANDRGVTYIDTTTAKLMAWTGTAWV